ncbi:reverse transcriptase domain-containing protein, partial [Vibrio parahaemolyticus]|nr:reverse transcriptase domain-containing protein [Vibrio parahaemolyticus]
MDSSYRRLQYVRYADDFLIGVIGEKSEAHIIQEEVTTFLQETLKLDIAADKSGIVHASKKTPFLGYEIHCYTGNRQRKTQRAHRHCTVRSVSERMQLHIPQKKLGVFCKKHRYGNYETYRPLHRNTLIHLSEAEIVKTYNAELRGLANYYALATNAKRDLNKLHGLWQGSMLKTLAA